MLSEPKYIAIGLITLVSALHIIIGKFSYTEAHEINGILMTHYNDLRDTVS